MQPADHIAVADIARELEHIAPRAGRVSMAKHVFYDRQGTATDTAVVVTLRPDSLTGGTADRDRIREWLRVRLKTDHIVIYVENEKK